MENQVEEPKAPQIFTFGNWQFSVLNNNEKIANEVKREIENLSDSKEIPKEYFKGLKELAEPISPGSQIRNIRTVSRACRNLTQITISNSVISIGEHAFKHCDSLTQIMIPSSVEYIGRGAFCDCRALERITIPSSVASIGDWAFDLCRSLREITIPSSVTSIGDRAFNLCRSLTQITIQSGVTSIGVCAFSGCCSLPQITIPSSVTSIKDGAFYMCSSLREITIPSSVTSIGECAFGDCRSLTQINIPASLFQSIGRDPNFVRKKLGLNSNVNIFVDGEKLEHSDGTALEEPVPPQEPQEDNILDKQ